MQAFDSFLAVANAWQEYSRAAMSYARYIDPAAISHYGPGKRTKLERRHRYWFSRWDVYELDEHGNKIWSVPYLTLRGASRACGVSRVLQQSSLRGRND